ncbi:ectonucleotide pyrophosphatase/phosphodiesterase [Lentimicrobium sp. S6]|uniref:alkaline phosphatase family protein n=1 Tax=Lentimicrobium sp. S6 TaxID=2735872 RepID=UPI00155311B5|nr:ectonucleotide pyrophosphatase/phosphodiesterase [Lentimicrobium sp. S6]NPD45787.1 alkaline phosphatase family protein [Lentimicrobium sp. S6]
MKNNILYLLLLALLISSCSTKEMEKEQPYLILLSMDGFRWDYPDSIATPNFDRMEKMGVKAESMQVSFPSKTFPNHYTLVTGLVPDHHGIVNNTFYAPKFDEVYSIGNREAVQNGKFYQGEPIWNTAEKQGMKAGSYFWVGSEADIQGMHPSYWKEYDHDFDFYQRVDSVMAWLSLEESKRPHLISWYVHEPDGVGHHYGPHSETADSTIRDLDALLGYFMKELSKHPLADKVNVIVLSDHGMGNIYKDKSILLTDYLKKEWYTYLVGGNPIYNIKAQEGFEDSIYLALENLKGLSIYKNEEMPAHLNYGTHERCLDFTIVADSTYSLLKREPRKGYGFGGTHGYDIHNKDMNAIFYAYGPAFKENYQQEMFKNVDVYPLMCEILNLTPAPNDGDLEEVRGMLK